MGGRWDLNLSHYIGAVRQKRHLLNRCVKLASGTSPVIYILNLI